MALVKEFEELMKKAREEISHFEDRKGGVISAGFSGLKDEDTMFLKLARKDGESMEILLRPDEMALIVWAGAGVLHEQFYRELK